MNASFGGNGKYKLALCFWVHGNIRNEKSAGEYGKLQGVIIMCL